MLYSVPHAINEDAGWDWAHTLRPRTTIYFANCSLNKAFSVGFTPTLYQFHLADFLALRMSSFAWDVCCFSVDEACCTVMEEN